VREYRAVTIANIKGTLLPRDHRVAGNPER
jgi:hypothetical protein